LFQNPATTTLPLASSVRVPAGDGDLASAANRLDPAIADQDHRVLDRRLVRRRLEPPTDDGQVGRVRRRGKGHQACRQQAMDSVPAHADLSCQAAMAAATHNILRTLKAEHDELRALFEQMEQTSDRAGRKRTELLGKIEANLMPHAKWEETVFYPAFAERANREGLKIHAEAVEEHRAVEKTVIPDVHAADVTTPQFAGRAKVFGELIDHHARDEEKEMFAMARKLFTTQELAEFDEAYEEWKASSASTLVSAVAGAKTGMKAAVRKLTRRAQ